ncbi:YesL family protein [Mesobacillus maritimus]|uniref:YesL family protein n=1 Tax=Mesobacillus maritimus TaxID=1643336 RepID=UPI0020411CE3|nr:YesL family protein [Mesobacillus maritimus]MCM3670931.1 YesL family protein [Mesobacillus maritimus]
MRSQKIVQSLDRFFTWITRLVVINVLWVLYTLMGLIVGGIFPATMAVLKIFRLWIMGDQEVPIWRTFKQEYRKAFIQSNVVGWILTFAGLILYLNYLVMKSMGEMNIVFYVAFYLLVLFYLNLVIWSFPQLAHYNGKIRDFFRNSIILGFGRFHYTMLIVGYIFTVLYVSLRFPGILPFFTISIVTYGWIWLSMTVFQKSPLKLMLER